MPINKLSEEEKHISELQINWCLDRLRIVKASIPKDRIFHTCVDHPDLPCVPCTKPHLEINEPTVCRIMIGDFEVERFNPQEMMP